MPTRLPCVMCNSRHRTNSRRVGGGKFIILCASCHNALVKLYDWHRANAHLDVGALTRVYRANVPKPAAGVAAPARDKIA